MDLSVLFEGTLRCMKETLPVAASGIAVNVIASAGVSKPNSSAGLSRTYPPRVSSCKMGALRLPLGLVSKRFDVLSAACVA